MTVKRFLNCTSSELLKMSKDELLFSIKASAGRVILAENDVVIDPMTRNLTNSEFVAAFGADLILLNIFDFLKPEVKGLDVDFNHIKRLRELTGKPIGVNIEPVDESATISEKLNTISKGRVGTLENYKIAESMGVDMLCITGNPSTGVSNEAIINGIRLARTAFSGVIIAGKMHGAGVNEPVITEEVIEEMINAGADIILIPAAGTIPGLSEDEMSQLVKQVHSKDKLVMGAIGTTQEGADVGTIRDLALTMKRAGVDIHHIGDGGFSGTADPENIVQLSVAVRGKRHTYHRMAQSIRR